LKDLKEKYKLIIEAIREKVAEDKISQKQISDDLEIPYQTLRQLFIDKKSNGQMPSVPSSQNLLAIALYLELDLQRILYPEKSLTDQELQALSKEDFQSAMLKFAEIMTQKMESGFNRLEEKFNKQINSNSEKDTETEISPSEGLDE
jgi:transcriptional regulator with XRE-family HTH domain